MARTGVWIVLMHPCLSSLLLGAGVGLYAMMLRLRSTKAVVSHRWPAYVALVALVMLLSGVGLLSLLAVHCLARTVLP
jgi:hypothetical protein